MGDRVRVVENSAENSRVSKPHHGLVSVLGSTSLAAKYVLALYM